MIHGVFRVWTTIKNSRGPIWWDIEAPCERPSQLAGWLNEGSLFTATHLWTRRGRDEEGKFLEVVRRSEVVLSKAIVQGIEVPSDRFIQFTEEAPAP